MTDQINGRDLRSLPLFSGTLATTTTTTGGSTPRAGRVRGDFRLGEPTSTPGPAPAVSSSRVTGFAGLSAEELPAWVGQRTVEGEIDWGLVAAFRAQASDQLTRSLGEDRTHVSREAQEEQGRTIVLELLDAAAAEAVLAGGRPWSPGMQQRLAQAVFDSLFRLGRLQPLVDDDTVENIIINGYDRVRLEHTDGTITVGPPVAESDQELIEFLAFIASRSEVNPRPFSEAQPSLDLRLDGGARLAATAWLTPRPAVSIRRHRLMRVTLADLVTRQLLSPVAASFLAAAVRAKKSIVVAGVQGVGKTTLVRALCAEIPRDEVLGTFETEYELALHELPDQHDVVFAWEARAGSGERGVDGRIAGQYSTAQQIRDSFRYILSRQIVGEVRGAEAWDMLKVMESGPGSICTTHATDAEGTVGKLVTCAMESGPQVTAELAVTKLAQVVDLIVYIRLQKTDAGGQAEKRRWVSEIVHLTPGESEKRYALTHVFREPQGTAGRAVAHVLPDELRDLAAEGFDLHGFHTEASGGLR